MNIQSWAMDIWSWHCISYEHTLLAFCKPWTCRVDIVWAMNIPSWHCISHEHIKSTSGSCRKCLKILNYKKLHLQKAVYILVLHFNSSMKNTFIHVKFVVNGKSGRRDSVMLDEKFAVVDKWNLRLYFSYLATNKFAYG